MLRCALREKIIHREGIDAQNGEMVSSRFAHREDRLAMRKVGCDIDKSPPVAASYRSARQRRHVESRAVLRQRHLIVSGDTNFFNHQAAYRNKLFGA